MDLQPCCCLLLVLEPGWPDSLQQWMPLLAEAGQSGSLQAACSSAEAGHLLLQTGCFLQGQRAVGQYSMLAACWSAVALLTWRDVVRLGVLGAQHLAGMWKPGLPAAMLAGQAWLRPMSEWQMWPAVAAGQETCEALLQEPL